MKGKKLFYQLQAFSIMEIQLCSKWLIQNNNKKKTTYTLWIFKLKILQLLQLKLDFLLSTSMTSHGYKQYTTLKEKRKEAE